MVTDGLRFRKRRWIGERGGRIVGRLFLQNLNQIFLAIQNEQQVVPAEERTLGK